MTVADERGYPSRERAAQRAARFGFLRGPKISRGVKGGQRPPVPHQADSAARIRAQLRIPLWKLSTSYFSLGEWIASSSLA